MINSNNIVKPEHCLEQVFENGDADQEEYWYYYSEKSYYFLHRGLGWIFIYYLPISFTPLTTPVAVLKMKVKHSYFEKTKIVNQSILNNDGTI